MDDLKNARKSSGFALVPLIIFILAYVGTGTVLSIQGVPMAFYQMPLPIPIAIGLIVSFIIFKGSINEKFNQVVKGCSDENIIIMCIIYLLAGAFSTIAKSMGGVDSTVNLGLTLIPVQFITAGIFILSCIIATATGTSMGTISAVVPIAVGVADKAGLSIPIMLGAVIGGAMFGDNLSVISDTTIVATRTQNVDMRDKFRMNFLIVLPAAIITFILLLIFARPIEAVELGDLSFNIVKVLPYFLVLILALSGVNVFVVLSGGIIVAGIIGIFYGDFTLLTFAGKTYEGFVGMSELFIGSLLCGGLVYMVTEAGGLNFIVDKLSKVAKNKKSAELSIAALVSAADIAIANNTIAILVSGQISKELSMKYKIDPRKTASLLDIFSCVFQGFVPYSAQLIVAGTLAGGLVAPIEIIPFLWYQFLLFIFGLVAIFIPYADITTKGNPWDFDKDMPIKKIKELEKESMSI